MATHVALKKNLEFWHWFPELLVKDLTPEQIAWQPAGHDTSIAFAIWHAYRAEDDLLHALVIGRASVYASGDWADRLRVEATGATPFGNGLNREQIGKLKFDIGDLLAYAKAVGDSIAAHLDAMTDAEAASEVALPFFTNVYPMLDEMTKAEVIAFFSIGHVSEHLGEVQMVRGLLGLKGAPL